MRRVLLTLGVVLAFAGGLAAQNTIQLLNTVYNAESTGNILTTVEKLSLPAATCDAGAAALTGWNAKTGEPAVATCVEGTNITYGQADYADGSSLTQQGSFRLPADWTGTIDLQLYWKTDATSGNVVWQVSTVCVADAETVDPAFNAAQTITDAAKGTTLQLNTASLSSVTTTGCAAGELFFYKILRTGAHGSDSLSATASLVSVEWTFRRAI
jgi:hypothetical protein